MRHLRWMLGLLVLLASLYIAYLNPGSVPVYLTPSQSYPIPIVALFFLSLWLGVFVTVVLNLLKEARGVTRWVVDRFGRRRARKREETYRKGIRFMDGGDWEGARVAFRSVLQDDARHVGALQKLGEVYRQEGRITDALRVHGQARHLAEDDVEVLYQLAADYRAGGRTLEAIKTLEEVRERDQLSPLPLQEMRCLFMERGDWERAYAIHRDLLLLAREREKAFPNGRLTAILLYEIGNLLLERGELKRACASYRTSLRAAEDFVPAYIAMGKAYLAREKPTRAVRVWERGFERTSSPILLRRLEEHFLAREQPGEVVYLYREALARPSQDPRVLLMAGEAFLRLEMLEMALEAFRQAEVFFASWDGLHLFLGRLHAKKGEDKAALRELQHAFELQSFWTAPYLCRHCDRRAIEWSGRCPCCLQWGTLEIALLGRAKEAAQEGKTPGFPARGGEIRWQNTGCLLGENVLQK